MGQRFPILAVEVGADPHRISGCHDASQHDRLCLHVAADAESRLKIYARRGTSLFHPGHHGTGIHRTDAAHGLQVGSEEIDHPLAHQVDSLTRRGEGKHGDALGPLHHRSAASGSEEDPP